MLLSFEPIKITFCFDQLSYTNSLLHSSIPVALKVFLNAFPDKMFDTSQPARFWLKLEACENIDSSVVAV